MFPLAAVRLSHFLLPLLLLLGGVLTARLAVLNEFFLSLFNVLPTLLLLLGGTFCVVYNRQRELSLLVLLTRPSTRPSCRLPTSTSHASCRAPVRTLKPCCLAPTT